MSTKCLLVQADRRLVRGSAATRRHILLTVTAPEVPHQVRPAVSLTLALDRSGSMAGEKIRLARDATVASIRALSETDCFAVVAFDEIVDVIVPATRATPDAKQAAARTVLGIQAGGSTNLVTGWLRAAEQVALGQRLAPGALGRVLLLTDGLANFGLQDRDEILRHVKAVRDRHVSTTTLGVGADFDEQLLGAMSDCGGGHFYYVKRDEEIPSTVASEVGETLDVAAREVRLTIEANTPFSCDLLNPYPLVEDGSRFTIDIGDLASAQQVSLAVAVDLQPCPTPTVTCRLTDREGTFGGAVDEVRFEPTSDETEAGQPRDLAVWRSVQKFASALAVRKALALNTQGNTGQTVRALAEEAARLRGLADGDEELLRLADSLEADSLTFDRWGDGRLLKLGYERASNVLMSRDASGRAERGLERLRHLDIFERPVILLARLTYDHRQSLGDLLVGLQKTRFSQAVDLVYARGTGALCGFNLTDSAGLLGAEDEAKTVERVGDLPPRGALRVGITSGRLADNFFSHWHEAEKTAIVSIADWGAISDVSMGAFLAYEILIHGLRALVPGYDPMNLFHEETRGCLYDFCRNRGEVEIKLQTADLCPACKSHLTDLGCDIPMIQEFSEQIRCMSTPNATASGA